MAGTTDKRIEILNCTQSLIVKGGYNGFSYADIEKVVGIRKASIHHHFPTKSGLVRELLIDYRQKVSEGLAGLDRSIADPMKRLRAYADHWQACISDGSLPICVCALLATEIPVLPEEIAAEVRGHFHSLRTWLTAVFKSGLKQKLIFVDKTAEIEAEIFMASVHGALLTARAYGDPKAFSVVMHPLLDRLSGP